MSRRKKLTALFVMIAMLLPVMPAIADPTATPPPLTGIAVDTQELNLLAGDSQVVTVSPIPADAEIETVEWAIGDEKIAEYDLDTPEGIKGTVTVVDKPENNGKTTTITWQAKDATNNNVGTPITVDINVKDITSITPNQARYVLKPGEEISGVGVKLAPEGIKADIEWEETGAASIEFDENTGKVSVKDDAKDGDLMILTAKVDSAHTQNTALQPVTIEILVSQIIDKIVLKDSGKELKIGEKFNVEIATPSYSLTADDVEWESSNEEVATVDANGIVTAVGSGKAIITVRAKKPYDGMDRYAEASIQITVAGEVTNDAITVDTGVIYVTDTNQQIQTVTATIKPVASKEVPFTITGDNANCIDVALVEADPDNPTPVSGKIKFDSKGKAVLKISIDPKRGNLSDGKLIGTITIGGEGCTPATIQVYYRKNQMIITNITPEHKKVTLNLWNYYDDKDKNKPNGKTYQPVVIFTPSDATDRNLIWEVQEQKDPQGKDVTGANAVLEIDKNNGAVTPKNPGTAVVRVRAATSYGKDDNGNDIFAEAFITFNVYAKLDSTGNTDEILDVWQNQNGQPLVPAANPDKSYPNENAALPIIIKGKHILQMQLNDPEADGNENWIWDSSKTTALKILTAEQDDPANNIKKGDYVDADGKKLPNGTIWLVSDKPGKGEITVRGEYSSQKRTFYFEVEEVVMTDFSLEYFNGTNGAWEAIANTKSEEIAKLPVSNTPSPVANIGNLGDVAEGRKIELQVVSNIPEATDQKVRWYSSDTKVATVSSKGVVTIKSDVGSAVITAAISYKETKQVGQDKVEETKVYAAAVKINAVPVKEINDITVYELDEFGNRILPAIITTNQTGQGGKIEFENHYSSDPEQPLTLKLGESHSFEVVGAIHDLNRASAVKWKAHLSGYVTVKQTVKDGKTILTLKASTSGKKAGGTVRVVATNVGNYQNDEDTTQYFNYPEIYVKLEAEPPEEISIINVPKLLEIGQEEQLEIKTKPSNRDKTVEWSVSDKDIAEIDPKTGVIRGLKQGVVTVVATTKDPNGNIITAEAEVQVGYKATGMKLNATSITLTGNEQFLLQVSAQPYALLEGQNIHFKVRDEEIAQAVVKDPQKPNEAVVSLYIPGNPQPKESTTIDVYVGGYEDPNDPTKIIGYQRKLTCRVKVGDTPALTVTDPELQEKLSKVEITVKPTDVTIEVGKSKKITTTIKGLSEAEKKRIIAKWVRIDDTTQTSSAVVDVDDLGVITVKNNPAGDSAQVQAKFYYVDIDGQEYPVGPNSTKPNASLEDTIISELVNVTVKPVLSAGITKPNGSVLAEPSLNPEITIRKSDLPITITVQSRPTAKDLEVAPSYNTAFGKYLKAGTRKQSDDKTAVTMDIEAQNVTFKKTKATVTFTEPTTKAKVVITLNILP